MKKRYVFVGDTEASKTVLKALIRMKVKIVGIVASPIELKETTSGYAKFDDIADELDIPLIETVDINGEMEIELLKILEPDYILVIAWHKVIKKDVLSIPKVGVIGRHNALLPQRRGCAPVVWALIDGLDETGVTLYWMTEGIDSGDMIMQKKLKIEKTDFAQDVLDKVNEATIKMFKKLIPKLEKNIHIRKPQNVSNALTYPIYVSYDNGKAYIQEYHNMYTSKRTSKDAEINWTLGARMFYDFLRAQSPPYPKAFFYDNGKRFEVQLKIEAV